MLWLPTGYRLSDLPRLGMHLVKDDVLKFPAKKNDGRTFVPLTKVSKGILEKYDYQFPKMVDQTYRKAVKSSMKEADISRMVEFGKKVGGSKSYEIKPLYSVIHVHDAVKTFITHCVENRIPPAVVASMTGKTSKVLLDHYYGTNEEYIKSEMARAFGTV